MIDYLGRGDIVTPPCIDQQGQDENLDYFQNLTQCYLILITSHTLATLSLLNGCHFFQRIFLRPERIFMKYTLDL